MIAAAKLHNSCQTVIAGAPSIDDEIYSLAIKGKKIPVLREQTFELVHHAKVALVTSGTATLETALLGTPQVACYRMNGSKLVYTFYRKLIKGKYVTLPNLIADEPIIPELLLHNCNVESVDDQLTQLLSDTDERKSMIEGYDKIAQLLTTKDCAQITAQRIIEQLR